MSDTVEVDEGATYEYLRHGLAAFILGLILLVVHWLIALPVLIFAIGLMSMKTGIAVDISNKQIRKFTHFLGYKNGKWIDLTKFVLIELKYNSQVSKYDTRRSTLFLPGLGKEKVGTAKTYDLIFTNDLEQQFLFNPFLKVSLALKIVKAIEKIDGLSVTNHVDNWVLNSFGKQRRR